MSFNLFNMKRLLFYLLIINLHLMVFGQITKQDADSLIQIYLTNSHLDRNTILYSLDSICHKSTIVLVNNDIVETPNDECYAYFLDEVPDANWSHQCRFLFVKIYDTDIFVINRMLPPINLCMWNKHTQIEYVANNEYAINTPSYHFYAKDTMDYVAENCYAVIISGGVDKSSNHFRYWNDCSLIYCVLTKFYGYKDENIYVIMSDGAVGSDTPLTEKYSEVPNTCNKSSLDLDGDNDNDIGYAATKENITNVFNELSNRITDKDFLFIFSTDHGAIDSSGNVTMLLWGGEVITADEFSREVNKIKAKSISIVMEQCHSGGFIPMLEKKGRIITTACTINESSNSIYPNHFDEFVYQWVSAVSGWNPDGNKVRGVDTNNDGYISMKEAFEYAKNNSRLASSETPQYIATKSHYGEFVTLYGDNLCSEIIVSNVCFETDSVIAGCSVVIDSVSVINSSKLTIESQSNTFVTKDLLIDKGSVLRIK